MRQGLSKAGGWGLSNALCLEAGQHWGLHLKHDTGPASHDALFFISLLGQCFKDPMLFVTKQRIHRLAQLPNLGQKQSKMLALSLLCVTIVEESHLNIIQI